MFCTDTLKILYNEDVVTDFSKLTKFSKNVICSHVYIHLIFVKKLVFSESLKVPQHFIVTDFSLLYLQ